jgi:AraC-like DNA-binding protein
MLIRMAQHEWLQKADTSIAGFVSEYYNFFYFPTPIEIHLDGKVTVTRPNACVFSAPKVARGFHFPVDTKMHWIHAYKEIEPFLEKYDIPLNCVFYPESTGFISELFRKMMQERLLDDAHKDEMLDSYTVEFLVKLSRATHSDRVCGVSKADQKKMRSIRWSLMEHPEKNWTIAEMAQRVSLSPSRFHAVYKETFGISPINDLLNARIDRAKTLLLLDDKPTIAEVAESLGYKNEYHFIRKFKAVTGMTPGTYRKNCR